jgi:hypothetical protein
LGNGIQAGKRSEAVLFVQGCPAAVVGVVDVGESVIRRPY